MKSIVLVFIGGGLGSVFRFLIGKFYNSNSFEFPWATFTVNSLGSFIIGLTFGYLLTKHKLPETTLLFITTGFCGGFTTFSTFTNESLLLLRNGQTNLFFGYTLGSVITGILCVWLAYILATKIF